MIKHIENKVYFLIAILLAYFLGIRIGEIVLLRLSDFNFVQNEVYVRKPKGNRPFTKGLPKRLKPILRWYLRKYRPKSTSDQFLLLPNGEPVTKKTLSQRMNRLSKKTGIKDLTFHALRAQYITRQCQAGHPLIDIAISVNHRSITTTEGYIHRNSRSSIEKQKGWS